MDLFHRDDEGEVHLEGRMIFRRDGDSRRIIADVRTRDGEGLLIVDRDRLAAHRNEVLIVDRHALRRPVVDIACRPLEVLLRRDRGKGDGVDTRFFVKFGIILPFDVALICKVTDDGEDIVARDRFIEREQDGVRPGNGKSAVLLGERIRSDVEKRRIAPDKLRTAAFVSPIRIQVIGKHGERTAVLRRERIARLRHADRDFARYDRDRKCI